MTLKTLKDLEFEYIEGDTATTGIRVVLSESLRKEAMKWIKEIQRKELDRDGFILCLLQFFNLKEDEIFK